MLYVLCFPRLEGAAARRIEAFRRRHEPERAALVGAHVTLVFGLRRTRPEALLGLAAETAAATPPFEIELARAEAFEDPVEGASKLLLAVGRGADLLGALHRRLYDGPQRAELRPDLPFRAHITVATARTGEVLAAAQEEAATLGLPLTGRVEALGVACLEGGRLCRLAELRLGEAVA